jgi:FkbM family methyltransferase
MNRREWLGGVSSSFAVGTAGGVLAGGIGGAALAYDHRSKLGRTSYAQQGEDLVVKSLCDHHGVILRTYLDIGANDPILGNNTYLFYLDGARGVLVEPNPLHCGRLRSVRPRDTILEAGIGPREETLADYYMIGDADHDGGDCNTFSKADADRFVAESKGRWRILEVRKMPLVSVNRVMEESFGGAPDFLSTDTEGLDLDIVRSLDFDRFRPAIICAEVLAEAGRIESRIPELMTSRGYSMRGSTGVNAIFVDDRRPRS